MTHEEIETHFNNLLDLTKKILKVHKGDLNNQDYKTWQNLIILTTCRGIFVPCRRLLYYSELK